MEPYAEALFVAPFEVVIKDFGRVIDGLNKRFGACFSALPHDEKMVSQCFLRIEEGAPTEPNGSPNESVVQRPSLHRARLKPALLHDLRNSRRMRGKLEEASKLYNLFCQDAPCAGLSVDLQRQPFTFPQNSGYAR